MTSAGYPGGSEDVYEQSRSAHFLDGLLTFESNCKGQRIGADISSGCVSYNPFLNSKEIE
jgi:hypothetical protein